jgi:hypothetical protein
MQRKTLAPVLAVAGGAVVLVLALVVGMNLTGKSKSSVDTSNLRMAASIEQMLSGIRQQGAVLGSPTAKVRLVEFADPQCPGCADFSSSELPEIIQNYVRSGELRIEYVGQTFVGKDSERMLRTALAAGDQNKFWNVIEMFYANQGDENSGYATDSYLRAIVGSVPGLNSGAVFSRWQDDSLAPVIKKAWKSFENAGFTGQLSTPSFSIEQQGKPIIRIKAERASEVPARLAQLLG